ECYNPSQGSVSVTVTVRRDGSSIPFQALLAMEPGFNRHRVAMADIARRLSLSAEFSIDLTPNEIPDGATLYFGAVDFVIDSAFQTAAPARSGVGTSAPRICKCIVWDLDNTLWDGILVEDGLEKIRLKPHIPDILKQLDERGILISAASKNNSDDAMAA